MKVQALSAEDWKELDAIVVAAARKRMRVPGYRVISESIVHFVPGDNTVNMKNILIDFSNHCNKALDAMKPGEKLDRKALANGAISKIKATALMNEMDGLNVLAVLVRGRGDFNTVKGPTGGTFKK